MDFWKRLFEPKLSLPNIITLIALVFIFYSIAKPNSAELASWVQAVGSILAIVVAAYLPIWHAKVALKRRQESLAENLRVISESAVESLCLLSSVFYRPDYEGSQMANYQNFHRGREWESLVDQLGQIPVAELSPVVARELSHLKDSVNFGAYVASLIPAWIDKNRGSSKPDVIRVLRAKRDMACLARSRLPIPQGMKFPSMTSSQSAVYLAELKRPPLEPMTFSDGEVYRRYVWKNDSESVPSCVYIYGVYTYIRGFGPSLIENGGRWGTFKDAETYVKGMCLQLNNEHMKASYIEIDMEAFSTPLEN